jgi:hypothetical protein
MVEAHGGTVELESSGSDGSVFVVTLPRDGRRETGLEPSAVTTPGSDDVADEAPSTSPGSPAVSPASRA